MNNIELLNTIIRILNAIPIEKHKSKYILLMNLAVNSSTREFQKRVPKENFTKESSTKESFTKV